MKLMKTLVATTALCVAAAGASAQEKVAISDLNWTGAKAIAHVIKAVITGPLGSEAEIVEGLSDQAIIAAGMDKSDGSADVWTDMWMPNQQGPWDQFIEDAGTVAHNQPYEGTQQLYVPSYMADKIKSFEDLKDPENCSAL
ncbi:MAG: glycine betaine ABC transporter substrate-binding protein [Pseudomonadota bacterium]